MRAELLEITVKDDKILVGLDVVEGRSADANNEPAERWQVLTLAFPEGRVWTSEDSIIERTRPLVSGSPLTKLKSLLTDPKMSAHAMFSQVGEVDAQMRRALCLP